MNWIDVATTSIPRCLTEKSIGSLLDSMDSTGFRLRWIFHLDWRPELEAMWEDTLRQSEGVAKRFDDAIVMVAKTNQGFGRSCLRVLRELRHDTLWIEDDWLWVKKFRLAQVQAEARDGFHLHRPGVRMGATTPGFWKYHVVEYLRDHYPQPPERATERSFKRILYRKAGFRNNQRTGGVPKWCAVELGKQVLADLGFDRNFFGVELAPYLRKSIDSPAN